MLASACPAGLGDHADRLAGAGGLLGALVVPGVQRVLDGVDDPRGRRLRAEPTLGADHAASLGSVLRHVPAVVQQNDVHRVRALEHEHLLQLLRGDALFHRELLVRVQDEEVPHVTVADVHLVSSRVGVEVGVGAVVGARFGLVDDDHEAIELLPRTSGDRVLGSVLVAGGERDVTTELSPLGRGQIVQIQELLERLGPAELLTRLGTDAADHLALLEATDGTSAGSESEGGADCEHQPAGSTELENTSSTVRHGTSSFRSSAWGWVGRSRTATAINTPPHTYSDSHQKNTPAYWAALSTHTPRSVKKNNLTQSSRYAFHSQTIHAHMLFNWT